MAISFQRRWSRPLVSQDELKHDTSRNGDALELEHSKGQAGALQKYLQDQTHILSKALHEGFEGTKENKCMNPIKEKGLTCDCWVGSCGRL